MCILCGALTDGLHWSEWRVGIDVLGSAEAENQRRRDRVHRTIIVGKVLRGCGLQFHDDWSGTIYLVMNRKGGVELVKNFGELWPAAERLAGRSLDPLDPKLMEYLEHSETH